MKSILQILRQPGKSLAGIILSALAAAILVICIGQYSATILTRANLDDRYDTIALVSDEYLWEIVGTQSRHYMELPEKFRSWVDEIIQTRSDMVKTEAFSGLLSACIPQMQADNFSQHKDADRMGDNSGCPYRCAMFEVTLTKVGTVPDEDVSYFGISETDVSIIMRNSISILCTGTIDRVLGLEQGFADPVGKTITLIIMTYDEEDLEALQLRTGEKYLVYGMDYCDVSGIEMSSMVSIHQKSFEELFESEPLPDQINKQIECIMTVCDYSSLPINGPDGQGQIATFRDLRLYYDYKSFTDDGYRAVKVPAEEYIPDYCVPTIARLEESAQDYLASEEGLLWRQALDEMEISHHGFPVMAVEKLGYQAAFARGQARIVEGRDFTEKERTDGSRVCIMAQSLAAFNNLQVGDTIDLRYYAYDPNIKVQQNEIMSSTAFPSAAVYSRSKGFLTETEKYTIVGLYRQSDAWQNGQDPYGFTPNTLFVPKMSVTCEMLTGRKGGIFYSLILQNGKKEEFENLQAEAGYPGLFICLDQGYSEIVKSLDAYESVSANALYVGLAAGGVIMLLFLVLFPLQQGRTVSTMNSLGASRKDKLRYMLAGSACILIPGGILGGIIGALLWERVTAGLMESVNVQIPLEANTPVTSLVLTSAYVLVMLAAVLAAAIPLTREKGLKRRK